MSSARAAAPNGPAAGGPAERGQSDWKGMVMKALLFYFGFNALSGLATNYLKGGADAGAGAGAPAAPAAQPGTQRPASASESLKIPGRSAPVLTPPLIAITQETTSSPLWAPNTELDFYIFLSTSGAPTHADVAGQLSPLVPGSALSPPLEDVAPLDAYPTLLSDDGFAPGRFELVEAADSKNLPVLKLRKITLEDERLAAGLAADLILDTPEEVMQNNGSIWADVVVVPTGGDVYSAPARARMRKMLTRLYPPRKNREGRRLIGGGRFKGNASDAEDQPDPAQEARDKSPVPYWHTNLTLALPEQASNVVLPVGKLPPPVLQHVHLYQDGQSGAVAHPTSASGEPAWNRAWNYPIVFPNTFWDLREDMYPVNATTPTLPLHISLYSTSWFKFQLLAAMSDSFDKQPGMGGAEIDMIKHTLLTTSPSYLVFTVFVTLLHMLFEFLAFSSDVSYWKKKDNMVGISVGTIFTSIVTQTIILLYLLDSSEETSWVILGPQAIGIFIEAWKLTKALTVSLKPSPPGSWIPYRLDVQDKHVLSKEELESREYDRLAFKIVACFAVPLLGGYTVYSAVYEEHRSIWSFTIATLCSFVYSFGFVALIPQLIVNYKMKSVAGMNAKTLVFRVLNTFVDDVFAFGMVKMPILHRLATLRDDVIFIVWLIQLKMYGMDKSRPNEYGQVVDAEARNKGKGKDEDEAKEGAEGKAIEPAQALKEGDAAVGTATAVSKGEEGTTRQRQRDNAAGEE